MRYYIPSNWLVAEILHLSTVIQAIYNYTNQTWITNTSKSKCIKERRGTKKTHISYLGQQKGQSKLSFVLHFARLERTRGFFIHALGIFSLWNSLWEETLPWEPANFPNRSAASSLKHWIESDDQNQWLYKDDFFTKHPHFASHTLGKHLSQTQHL